ncbi:MAG: hypothetical protein Barrevirus17_9 [Barrevirus sp.]|uniref:Glycosyltransferase n=1 Tax=Barrevirus sp. TaxID=2487763 RepID=A0A3G4ZUB4_9VIRU|nr:MAG: hypothetical protein Barrevirus17_9 [Barrevirus sp.]
MISNCKIFISIASYRDPELKPTIKSLLENADYPDNLTFGICWQHGSDEELDAYKNDKRFKIIDVLWSNSKGCCWARSEIQKLHTDESYYLQLDSHHRFIKGWDTVLIDMYKGLQKDGYNKPILTTYATSYDPKNSNNEGKAVEPYLMKVDRFSEGQILFRPEIIPNYESLTRSVKARFISGHFIFTTGLFCKEIPYDPNIYFTGEEITLSIRAFTKGYSLFHPHKLILWHRYNRDYRITHWDDHNQENKKQKKVDATWYDRDKSSVNRVKKLLGQYENKDPKIDFGIYGFGPLKSLKDYELYSGINFKNYKYQKYTFLGLEPPNPINTDIIWLPDDTEYSYEVKVSWLIQDIHKCGESKDYLFWYIGIMDQNNKELYRYDLIYNDNKNIMIKDGEYLLKFKTNGQPYKFKIWPHSVTKQWLEQYDTVIKSQDIKKL